MNISLKRHRTWEDWLVAGLGLLLLVSPTLVQQQVPPEIGLNAVALGFAVIFLAAMEYFDRQPWEEVFELIAGLAAIALPFTFAYSGTPLGILHLLIGLALAALAALELWQHTPPPRPM